MASHDENVRFVSRSLGGDCTIGVDVGTTSVKAVAVDADGIVVARTRVPHRVGTPSADHLEHDVARAWRRGPRRAFAAVSAELDGPAAGVAVTSMVPSITAVDRRGRALLPGLLYGDARARIPGADGAPVGPANDPGDEREQGRRMLDWAVRQVPGAHGYWNCQAMATHALTGVPAVDMAAAMSFGDLVRRGRWDAAALAELGLVEEQLPVIGPMGGAIGQIPGTETAFAGGSIDAFCEQIVAGATKPGDVLAIFGATLIVWVVTDQLTEAPGLLSLPHTVPGLFLIGGPSNAGALFADWVHGLVGKRTRPPANRSDQLESDHQRPGDPGQVPVWLPYLRGERTPFHDFRLRASVHRLDIAQGPDALIRGAHEASGFVIRRMIERSSTTAHRIVATGGGSRSLAWMQAVADATGLPVDTVEVSEGAALGAAFLARMAAGLTSSFEAAAGWARVGRRVDPDPAWAAAAAQRYDQFEALGPGSV
jgi:xylulokinase